MLAVGALWAGAGMFLVLFFQLSCGFEAFQNKKVKRGKKNPALFHLEFILVPVPLALLGSPGRWSWVSGVSPLLVHSRLFPFSEEFSILGELFFSGRGSFYDRVSFWQTHDFSRSR